MALPSFDGLTGYSGKAMIVDDLPGQLGAA